MNLDLERELARLLADDGIGHDLLGLMVAAGGGLSANDLAELAGVSAWEVRHVLRAAPGRTFTSRSAHGQAPVYVLAHEELQQAAATWLGEPSLSAYRARLHAWAERYSTLRWPDTAPEYLLRGYHRLLRAISDIPRMTDLTADRARQDRMRGSTGGDAAALSEISAVQGLVLPQERQMWR